MTSAAGDKTECVVVLRARSSAKFLPEQGFQLIVDSPDLDLQGVRVRAFTRWVDEGGKAIPRELIIEARGYAGSLDEAVGKFLAIARPVATMAAFVANVRVGPLEVHLAYEATPTSDERAFLEVFLPDERGALTEGRFIKQKLMDAATPAFIALEQDAPRVGRALRQYELALREWYVGGEWLALNHLWIAAENLTKALIRKATASRGITEEELAREYHLVTDDPERPRWRELLGMEIRREVIFSGDISTYRAAKDASDKLEHGVWELDRIAALALKAADKTFHHVRAAIVDLLDLDATVAEELVAIPPKDVQSTRKVVRGRLLGFAEDPAPTGEMYPRLEWTSVIEGASRDGERFEWQPRDRLTVRTHPDVGFQLDRVELRGRLQDGESAVELADEDVRLEQTAAPLSQRMLDSARVLVDATAATGAEKPHTFASRFAFSQFGQAVALFHAIHVLLEARQPVECLPALRSLVFVAARFEQMTDPAGPGLGIAVRAVLDGLEALQADPVLTRSRQQDILAAAHSQGLTVPSVLEAPATSSIYVSLGAEMGLAEDAINAGYTTSQLHMVKLETELLGFQIALEPGPFTDLIATAAVIAFLELLKQASALFLWDVPQEEVDSLLGEARALNEVSAQNNLRAESTSGENGAPSST